MSSARVPSPRPREESGANNSHMHGRRRRIVYPDGEDVATASGAAARSPPPPARRATPTRSAITPRRMSTTTPAPIITHSPAPPPPETPSAPPARQSRATSVAPSRGAPTAASPSSPSHTRSDPPPRGRRSQSTLATHSRTAGHDGETIRPPPAPAPPETREDFTYADPLPQHVATQRGGRGKPFRCPIAPQPSPSPLSGADPAAPTRGSSHLSTTMTTRPRRYTTPQVRAVECVYFDAVPRRGFEGLFRCAATVVAHTSPAASTHVRPSSDGDAGEEGRKEEDALAPAPTDASREGGDSGGDEDTSQGNVEKERTEGDSLPCHNGSNPNSARLSHSERRGSGYGRALRHPNALATPSARNNTAGAREFSRAPSATSSVATGPRVGGNASARGPRRARSPGRFSTGAGAASQQSTRPGLRTLSGPASVRTVADTRTARHNQAKLNRQLDMPKLHAEGLHSSLWVAGQDGSIEVRSLADTAVVMSVVPAKRTTRTVVTTLVQPTANVVVAGMSDGSLRAFDAASLAEIAEVNAHSSAVTCLTVTNVPLPGNSDHLPTRMPVLVTGSSDWTIGLWRAQTLEPVGRLQGNRRGVTALCAAANGCFLFTGCEDGALRVWNIWEGGGVCVEVTREEKLALQDALSAAKTRTRSRGRAHRARRETGGSSLANSGSDEEETGSDSNERGGGADSPDVSLALASGEASRCQTTTSMRRTGATGAVAGRRQPNRTEADCSIPQPLSRLRGESSALLAGEGTEISPLRESTARPFSEPRAAATKKMPRRGKKVKKTATNRKLKLTSGGGNGNGGGGTKVASKALRRAEAFIASYTKASRTHDITPLLVDVAGLATVSPLPPSPVGSCSSSYTDPLRFNWPVDAAHREAVTGLVVVEDRWLVSVSRDTTAKVFGLPNGAFVRSLVMQRKIPLTAVLYDTAQLRLLVGGADGTVLGFDMRTAEMELALHVRPPTPSFSSVFTPIERRSLHRFYLCTSASPHVAGDAACTRLQSVAAFDKTTLSHGPGRTFTTYRVGEPSLRELKGTMQLSHLQAQVVEHEEMRERTRAMGTLEEMEWRDGRRCTRTLSLWHARQRLSQHFERWKWFTLRKGLRRERVVNVTLLQSLVGGAVLRGYFVKWRRFVELIRLQTHRDVVGTLERRTCSVAAGAVDLSQTLAHHSIVRQRKRHAHTSLVRAMAEAKAKDLLCRFYSTWVSSVCSRRGAERREVAYHRLLLSFSGPRYSSTAFVWQSTVKQALRRSRLQTASTLLSQWQTTVAVPQLRWSYWLKWSNAVREARRQRARNVLRDAWELVEPLSAILVQPALLRARYFSLWRDYAAYVSHGARLAEERHTMQREYLSLQNTIDNPSTVEQLRAEEAELETAIARAAFERDAMSAKERVLRQEVTSLRMSGALKVLLTGFSSESRTAAVVAGARGSTPFGVHSPSPQPHTEPLSGQSSRRGSTTHFLSGSTLTVPPVLQFQSQPAHGRTGSWLHRSTGSSVVLEDDYDGVSPSSLTLLQQLKSVMNAVKGTALQYARDEKQVASAYNFALHIPVVDPCGPQRQQQQQHQHSHSNDLSLSYGSLGSGGGGGGSGNRLGAQHKRQLSHSGNVGGANSVNWSVTMTSTGSAGAARRISSTTNPAHRAGYSPRISGGQLGRATHCSEAAASAKRFASLSEAFDETTQQLHAVLCTAAREAGVDLEGTNGLLVLPSTGEAECSGDDTRTPPAPAPLRLANRGDDDGDDDEETEARAPSEVPQPQPRHFLSSSSPPPNTAVAARPARPMPLQGQPPAKDALQQSLRWLRFVPGKTRRKVMELALQLVMLYDSFAAHSEMSLETGGSGLSTRGATTVRALPLSSLCTEATATLLIRHAAVLLELLQPNLWHYQHHLLGVAEAHLQKDAVLVSVTDPNGPPSLQPASTTFRAGSPHQPPVGKRGGRSSRAATQNATAATDSTPSQSHSVVGDDARDDGSSDGGHDAAVSGSIARAEGSPRPQRPAADSRRLHHPQLRLSTAALAAPGARRGHHQSSGANARSVPEQHLPSPSVVATAGGGVNTSLDSGEVNDDSVVFGQSVRSYSAASTPRSLTPRSLTPRALTPRSGASGPSAAVAGTIIRKPFLGFRVSVQRESGPSGRGVITVKEIVPSYINAAGDVEEGPALLAGMAVGDELARFAGYTVTDLAAFNAIVSRHVKPGIDMPVTLVRNGQRIDTKIHVGLKSNVT